MTCTTCHNAPAPAPAWRTSDGRPVCAECADAECARTMATTGRGVLYVTAQYPAETVRETVRTPRGGTISRCVPSGYTISLAGSRTYAPTRVHASMARHARAACGYVDRLDIWFTGPDGQRWHGACVGDNQLLRCRRIGKGS